MEEGATATQPKSRKLIVKFKLAGKAKISQANSVESWEANLIYTEESLNGPEIGNTKYSGSREGGAKHRVESLWLCLRPVR